MASSSGWLTSWRSLSACLTTRLSTRWPCLWTSASGVQVSQPCSPPPLWVAFHFSLLEKLKTECEACPTRCKAIESLKPTCHSSLRKNSLCYSIICNIYVKRKLDYIIFSPSLLHYSKVGNEELWLVLSEDREVCSQDSMGLSCDINPTLQQSSDVQPRLPALNHSRLFHSIS